VIDFAGGGFGKMKGRGLGLMERGHFAPCGFAWNGCSHGAQHSTGAFRQPHLFTL